MAPTRRWTRWSASRSRRRRSDHAHRLMPLRPAAAPIAHTATRCESRSAIASLARSASGSAFSVQARWPTDAVEIEGGRKNSRSSATAANRRPSHSARLRLDVHRQSRRCPTSSRSVGALDDPYHPDVPLFRSGSGASIDGSRSSDDDVEHSDLKALSYSGGIVHHRATWRDPSAVTDLENRVASSACARMARCVTATL